MSLLLLSCRRRQPPSYHGSWGSDRAGLRAGLNKGALKTVMGLPPLVLQALAFAVDYLKPFGMEAVLQMSNSFRPFNTRQEMALSTNTLTCARSLKPCCTESKV